MVGGRLACFWPKIGTWKPAGNQVHAAIYGDSFDTTVKVTDSQATTILKRLAPDKEGERAHYPPASETLRPDPSSRGKIRINPARSVRPWH